MTAPQITEGNGFLPASDRQRGHVISQQSQGPDQPLPGDYTAGIVVTAALCLSAAFGAAHAGQPSEPSLLETIELWLVANFDLPAAENPPALGTMTAADLVALRYGPDSSVSPGDVVAAYDHGSRTIYLIDGWRGHDAAELSVLVHEMVHHLQASADMRFACPAERERLAYEAQDAWLQLFGENLTSAVNIDPAALLVSSVCTH
ncbi:DUF6647 family protein [Paracoccus spongiarum]|uniref:DUF6647 domain-containing protein n=1 Tax=Paracoccus spongiarum TaxID=3064387 RepID=A0ABT9JHV3_9RHOB|nr:DUF6647 family protein [Paracoccus sp. 2205BS29-5]MDP5308627.1 hypothetical protein [Paracoccus sp. 2205BS29-5]